ncbi:multidrug resistance protein 4 [Limtongia smithiae]|uniref:multidrug resistance protein 4 n=1 Tax=Limtongia smithiae TaxID=1125753 RepID=UPI0034CFE4C3
MGKARVAVANIKRLFSVVPTADTWSDAGNDIDPETLAGAVEFEGVHFRYPTHGVVSILCGLNLKVNRGQYVALVGASRYDKSTTVRFIESFYRPLAGKIFLDGKDIASINITKPTLDTGTIRENSTSDEHVISACRRANIHDFITSLPDGSLLSVTSTFDSESEMIVQAALDAAAERRTTPGKHQELLAMRGQVL